MWLSNGAHYEFRQPRSAGAPGDYSVLFHFTAHDWVMLDTESIVEIMPLAGKR